MAEEPYSFDSSAQEAADALEADARRLKRDQEEQDFIWFMSQKQGRRVMWRLLGITGLFRNPHHIGGLPTDTAFRAGEQNIGQQLLAEIHALTPEKYSVMTQEQVDHERRRTRSRPGSNSTRPGIPDA